MTEDLRKLADRLGFIMLDMAKAEDDSKLWERRYDALINIYNERTGPFYADSHGKWTLADFLSYVGDVCGWQNLEVKQGDKP